MAISVDGCEVARGMTGDDLTYPVTAFGYLVAHARERGVTLKRGEIASRQDPLVSIRPDHRLE